MSWRRSVLGRGVALGLALAAACGQEGGAESASSAGRTASDVPSGAWTIEDGTSSDPEAKVIDGVLYVYSSSDLPLPNGGGPDYYGPGRSNFYPMNTTKVHYLNKNGPPWNGPRGGGFQASVVFNESTIARYWNVVQTPKATNHLWAPAIAKVDSAYYLLVPDVEDFDPTHSYIYVSRSTDPLHFDGSYKGGWVRIPAQGYASDPALAQGPDGQWYLAWADGDYDTPGIACGGISIGKIHFQENISDSSAAWVEDDWRRVSIDDIPTEWMGKAGGPCAGKGPYIEGASLYYLADYAGTAAGPWYLVFPLNPGGGMRSAIAYARATSAMGPYDWKGVIMDPSTTEWTNQASIVKWGGDWIFFYHDGPSGPPGSQRRIHAECFQMGADGAILDKSGIGRPIARTQDGIKCATHYPITARVTVSVGSGKSITVTDPNSGNGNAPCTRTFSANGINQITCSWNMTQGQQINGYCGNGGYPSWTGCSFAFRSACVTSGPSVTVTARCN